MARPVFEHDAIMTYKLPIYDSPSSHDPIMSWSRPGPDSTSLRVVTENCTPNALKFILEFLLIVLTNVHKAVWVLGTANRTLVTWGR